MKTNLLVVITTALMLAACAHAPKQDVAKESAETVNTKQTQIAKVDVSETLCDYTRSTGTMLKTKRCRTRAQTEADREMAKDTLKAIHTSDNSMRETTRQ